MLALEPLSILTVPALPLALVLIFAVVAEIVYGPLDIVEEDCGYFLVSKVSKTLPSFPKDKSGIIRSINTTLFPFVCLSKVNPPLLTNDSIADPSPVYTLSGSLS